jgi:hypothetical protein
MPEPVAAPSDAQGFRDRLVGGIEIEAFRVELPAGPATHCLVLGVLGVEPGFEETEISRRSADVLGRGEIGCRRRIWDILPRPARGCGASSFGGPAVAEIIFVEDREAIVLVIRKNKVSQPDLGSFESLMIGQAVLVEFWRTDDQAADIELVEVAVRPGKRRLNEALRGVGRSSIQPAAQGSG